MEVEGIQSHRDKILTSDAGLDQISSSDPKPGTSKQPDDLPTQPNIRTHG